MTQREDIQQGATTVHDGPPSSDGNVASAVPSGPQTDLSDEATGTAMAMTATTTESRSSLQSDEEQRSEPARSRRSAKKSADRRRLRARRVDRIIRRIDPWSVLKISFLFYLCLWIIVLLSGSILWIGANRTGVIGNVESFITELFGLESFNFEGSEVFRGSAIGGLILVFLGTGFNVLVAVLFNLISDLTGGIRVSVIELQALRKRLAPKASLTTTETAEDLRE